MKKKAIKLSAHEINKYTYCPYQWYYGRIYGQKALKEKYKALTHGTSQHESHFKKGLHFHRQYYRRYKWQRALQIILILAVILLIVGGLWQCWQQ